MQMTSDRPKPGRLSYVYMAQRYSPRHERSARNPCARRDQMRWRSEPRLAKRRVVAVQNWPLATGGAIPEAGRGCAGPMVPDYGTTIAVGGRYLPPSRSTQGIHAPCPVPLSPGELVPTPPGRPLARV